jgi:hypothetical protein
MNSCEFKEIIVFKNFEVESGVLGLKRDVYLSIVRFLNSSILRINIFFLKKKYHKINLIIKPSSDLTMFFSHLTFIKEHLFLLQLTVISATLSDLPQEYINSAPSKKLTNIVINIKHTIFFPNHLTRRI